MADKVAFSQQFIGGSLELAIHEQLGGAYLESLENGRLRVHVPLGMTGDELVEKLGETLGEERIQIVLNLLANDQTPRTFENKGDFVLIRPITD